VPKTVPQLFGEFCIYKFAAWMVKFILLLIALITFLVTMRSDIDRLEHKVDLMAERNEEQYRSIKETIEIHAHDDDQMEARYK
jgi:predicted Holliday junction resolvase-like endonuclease